MAGACLVLIGCAKPAPLERAPTLAVVHADPSVLATAHPAWPEVEEIRSRLLEAGVAPAEPAFGPALAPGAADEVSGSAATAHPGAGAREAEGSVHSGDADLADIVARGARPSPQLGGPPADAVDEAVATAPPGGAAVGTARASEEDKRRADAARTRRLASAYADALRASGRGEVNPAERVRAESRLAAAEESAKARANWEAEQAVSANRNPPEDAGSGGESPQTPPPSTVGPATDAGRRLDELHYELERETGRLDDFSRRTARSAQEAAPSWPSERSEAESSAALESGAPARLAADRARLAERYGDLVRRIEAEVRAVAVSVGRAAGYDVRFDGSGPDRTDEIARLLRRFYAEPAGGAREKTADVADDR